MSETTNSTLNAVSETLPLPLYNCAMESLPPDAMLKDEKAVTLVTQIPTMRIIFTREMDRCVRDFMNRHADAVVIHIGYGLNSRFERVDNGQVE